jgi:hypothetical protein
MAKKRFNIGMAAIGALAGGMAGKYIYDKFGNKNPVAKKVAEAKSDASSKTASDTASESDTISASRNASPSSMAAGMRADRSVPMPTSPEPSPNPLAKADGMNYNQEMAGVNTAVPTPPPSISPTTSAPSAGGNMPSAQDENIIPGMRRGGMVGSKASSGQGLSVRGGGKAVKGLGKVRVF